MSENSEKEKKKKKETEKVKGAKQAHEAVQLRALPATSVRQADIWHSLIQVHECRGGSAPTLRHVDCAALPLVNPLLSNRFATFLDADVAEREAKVELDERLLLEKMHGKMLAEGQALVNYDTSDFLFSLFYSFFQCAGCGGVCAQRRCGGRPRVASQRRAAV